MCYTSLCIHTSMSFALAPVFYHALGSRPSILPCPLPSLQYSAVSSVLASVFFHVRGPCPSFLPCPCSSPVFYHVLSPCLSILPRHRSSPQSSSMSLVLARVLQCPWSLPRYSALSLFLTSFLPCSWSLPQYSASPHLGAPCYCIACWCISHIIMILLVFRITHFYSFTLPVFSQSAFSYMHASV